MPKQKKKDDAVVKNTVVRLRVTKPEAKEFRERAIKAGCKTVSEYIRLRCIQDADEQHIEELAALDGAVS